ncbi:Rgg/GadR/MutR family transcriptional regulator [Lactococcus allomyrinae]|uniref:Rgg/GadR/MutR family transcriptional regulator n=1 Tax=Lactococcus allomyrinae TaxID=2419773 RepID=A0A387BBC5_9LACT|nr:Rgg/GadR/MutR family transcriptional regulator [Lactococcus allomyrinae]AYG01073.1 Rgg/GadR/MutR family transcriptional regulator [Lactococcus allomyrinae]
MANSNKTNDNIGEIYRNFRKSKGFSQFDASYGTISVSQLSSFENGNSGLSVKNFLSILQNINVTTFEFEYAYNKTLNSTDELLYSMQISEAFLSHNIRKLKSISKDIDNSIKKSPQKTKYKLDKISVEAVIAILDKDYIVKKENIIYIRNYLLEIKEWGKFEILLLGRCIAIFDAVTLSILAHNMINPIQITSNLHYTKHSTVQTLLTLISTFIEQKQFGLALEFIEFLENINIAEYHMYDKLTLKYNKALLRYKQGDISALVELEKCQEILEYTDCFKTATIVDEELKLLNN